MDKIKELEQKINNLIINFVQAEISLKDDFINQYNLLKSEKDNLLSIERGKLLLEAPKEQSDKTEDEDIKEGDQDKVSSV